MIVWRGFGFLSIIIYMAGTAIAMYGAQHLHLERKATGYALVAGMVLAAAINWLAGRALNKSRSGSEARRHSLFEIPMEWWSLVMLAGAIYLAAPALIGR